MKFKFSNILVYGTLILLACFLIFWLWGEYEKEKNVLFGSLQLEFINETFSLDELMKGRNEEEYKSFNIQIQGDYEFLPDSGLIDSRLNNWVQMFVLDEEDSIYYQENESQELLGFDQLKERASSLIKFNEFLKEKQVNMNTLAMKRIIPRMIFAIFLFCLLLLGIFLLKKNYQEQQQLLKNKNTLISNITHELRTPIATIGIALEAIQDFNIKEDKEKTNTYIQTSRKELKRLSTSIDQILQLNQLDQKNQTYHFQNHSLQELCIQVIEPMKLPMQKKNIGIELLSPKEKICINVDEYHFKNMLFNLIDNGIKYGKNNGHIWVKLHEKPGFVFIEIQDDGEGIDTMYHKKIFERFFRVPTGDQHNVKGYGLGLSYVQEIVEVHNGTISVQSEKNKGTSFIIKLPKLSNQ